MEGTRVGCGMLQALVSESLHLGYVWKGPGSGAGWLENFGCGTVTLWQSEGSRVDCGMPPKFVFGVRKGPATLAKCFPFFGYGTVALCVQKGPTSIAARL